jgi:hypothetical protein
MCAHAIPTFTDMAQKGWVIKGKSREILEHEARQLVKLGLPEETEEDRNTVASGILFAWSCKSQH